jgi:LacI family transcriptional regulator
MSVTIKDVARQAGVSVASVSRALNGHDSVTPETRQRIINTAAQLRYTPHSAARSLITRRHDTIGFVLPELHGEFFSELIRGVDHAARASRLHLLVSSSHGNATEASAALRAMLGRVDGLLLMSPHVDADTLANILPVQLPVVLINVPVDNDIHSSLRIDNHTGAFTMTRHLIERGHRRIAFITGPKENFDAAERERGYRDALAQFAPAMQAQVLDGDFSEEAGQKAGEQIAALKTRPDAVFAANDMMAVGCLFALTGAGLRVPQDVAVAGFDDIPIARFVRPSLTTMRVNIADLGERAAATLIATLREGRAIHHTVLKPELVLRDSCAGASDDS